MELMDYSATQLDERYRKQAWKRSNRVTKDLGLGHDAFMQDSALKVLVKDCKSLHLPA